LAEERYRPDIDGLRAIAVLSVIGFHVGFRSFAGGFVGVDVFFVISGFLITRLIRDQVGAGTFTFRTFELRAGSSATSTFREQPGVSGSKPVSVVLFRTKGFRTVRSSTSP